MQFLIVGLGAGEYGDRIGATKLKMSNLWQIPIAGEVLAPVVYWEDIQEKPEDRGVRIYRKKEVEISNFGWNEVIDGFVYQYWDDNLTENSLVDFLPLPDPRAKEVIAAAEIEEYTTVKSDPFGFGYYAVIFAKNLPTEPFLVDVLITTNIQDEKPPLIIIGGGDPPPRDNGGLEPIDNGELKPL